MYTETSMRTTAVRHKHLKLDQGKIDFAKRYFGVDSEQQAIERALCPRLSFLSSTGAISCTVLSCVDGLREARESGLRSRS